MFWYSGRHKFDPPYLYMFIEILLSCSRMSPKVWVRWPTNAYRNLSALQKKQVKVGAHFTKICFLIENVLNKIYFGKYHTFPTNADQSNSKLDSLIWHLSVLVCAYRCWFVLIGAGSYLAVLGYTYWCWFVLIDAGSYLSALVLPKYIDCVSIICIKCLRDPVPKGATKLLCIYVLTK